MLSDVLTFTSEAFSLEPPVSERGLRYDLPLGDDIAAYLKEQLECKRVDWELSGPFREDYGAVLMLDRAKKVFTVTVSWQGGNSWALVFGQSHGCIGWLFRRKSDAQSLNEIKGLVDQVVTNEPLRFQTPRWIADADFYGLASHFVIPE